MIAQLLPWLAWVHWSQDNGIVCYGKIVGEVRADEDTQEITHYVVNYWYNPASDKPLRTFSIVEWERLHVGLPTGRGWEGLEAELVKCDEAWC